MRRIVGMLLMAILLALALPLAHAEVIKRPNPDGSVSLIIIDPTSSTPDVIAATKQAMQAPPASRIISERHEDGQTRVTVPVGSVTGCGVGELPRSRQDALRAYATLQAAL